MLTGQREGQRFPSHGVSLSLDWEAKEAASEVRRAAFSNPSSGVTCVGRGDKGSTESCREWEIKEWVRKR